MAAALPIAKLGALLLKTLSKPLAKSLKESAKRHPRVSQVLVSIGEASHQLTARLSVMAMNGKVKSIPSLDPTKALERGSDIFGEGFILSVASGILVAEYVTSAAKTKAKEVKKMAELDAIDEDLQTRLLMLEKRCNNLEAKLQILGGVGAVNAEEVREEVRKSKQSKVAEGNVNANPSSVKFGKPNGTAAPIPGSAPVHPAPPAAKPPAAGSVSYFPDHVTPKTNMSPKYNNPLEKLNSFGINTSVYDTDATGSVLSGSDIASRIQSKLKSKAKSNGDASKVIRDIEAREAFTMPSPPADGEIQEKKGGLLDDITAWFKDLK
jgi:hypothetical protein